MHLACLCAKDVNESKESHQKQEGSHRTIHRLEAPATFSNLTKKKARQTFVQRAFPQVKLYYYLIVRVHFKYFLNHIKTGLVFDFLAHTSDIGWINDF